MSDDLSLLMMQLPQKSRLVHSDGRRGEIKFLRELGNPKNENHWKLTCPRHLPSHVDLHYLARAPSTFDKNSFHRRAAKGCNNFSDWMRSDSPSFSSLTTHQYIDKGMFSKQYSKYCRTKLSSCSSSWDIPISKLRLVNGCSDNPKPLLFSKHYEFLFLEALSLCGLT